MAEVITTIPDEFQRQLAEQIKQNVPIGQGAADDARTAFCNSWPGARAGLDGLRSILVLVPGVNVFAGPAITIVIAAGDAAKSVLCK